MYALLLHINFHNQPGHVTLQTQVSQLSSKTPDLGPSTLSSNRSVREIGARNSGLSLLKDHQLFSLPQVDNNTLHRQLDLQRQLYSAKATLQRQEHYKRLCGKVAYYLRSLEELKDRHFQEHLHALLNALVSG